MKVGDPVNRYYKHLRGYSNSVFCIKRMSFDNSNNPYCELAQEDYLGDHYSYAYASELKKSKFTKKAHKNLQNIRERWMIESKIEEIKRRNK